MPKIVKYNVEIECKKCSQLFTKQPKTGNLCHVCRNETRNDCRARYTYKTCSICKLPKPENRMMYCNKCHHIKYKAKYKPKKVKAAEKLNTTDINELVYRLQVKQFGFIYSLYDINDIIECYYRHRQGVDLIDIYPAGQQIQKMWQHLLNLSNYGKTESSN